MTLPTVKNALYWNNRGKMIINISEFFIFITSEEYLPNETLIKQFMHATKLFLCLSLPAKLHS